MHLVQESALLEHSLQGELQTEHKPLSAVVKLAKVVDGHSYAL